MQIPSPKQLLNEFPLSHEQQKFIASSRSQISDILNDKCSQMLLIVGPCSIHDSDSSLEYARRLKALIGDISSYFFPIMRVYFEKPRTVKGWKGYVSDPHLNGSHDFNAGLRLTRQLLLQLTDMHIPIAAEFLEPSSVDYFADVVSWGCIGARTVESQVHRQLASMLPMPLAFKNSTNGSIDTAINGIIAAASAHTFISTNQDGRLAVLHSKGNNMGHLVLRGGERETNYDLASIEKTLVALKKGNIAESVLIDCSHDNSKRSYKNQVEVFQSVINQVIEGNRNIRGFLLESHIHEGSQEIPKEMIKLKYGVSVTDPCISWEMTEGLLRWSVEALTTAKDTVLRQANEYPTCV